VALKGEERLREAHEAVDARSSGRYTEALTVRRLPRYKPALVVALLLSAPGLAAALNVAGAMLPDEARKVGENRYQLERDYESIVKFYRTTYPPRYTRKPIADQPGVKAIHIENPDAKPGQWEGLNVYELKGEVRIFVLVKRLK
jgi:hypothetical protein